ncbi:hypothetical protein OSH04_13340 [Alcaligenes sp. A-TC2]|uniref:hypothetical protein n=1 Tax=Alcaligenes nematophilus TaxID=2994643 RepID=UPI002253E603|nr:hypothetical protein [Alcaligenes nematophilus]MCX5472702.1 hypothetical protein [Alcaligenes nematophilus]
MFGFDALEGNKSITFYDGIGRITGFLSGPPGVIEVNKKISDESWVEGEYSDEIYYVIDGVAKFRKEMDFIVNGKILKQLPMPCKVFINQSEYQVEDGEVELVFDQPGIYKVKISAWPFLDKEIEIEN